MIFRLDQYLRTPRSLFGGLALSAYPKAKQPIAIAATPLAHWWVA
jgi:hypothetical protein